MPHLSNGVGFSLLFMQKKCPQCKGKKCPSCNERGYVYLQRKQFVKKKAKSKAKRLTRSQERKIVQKKQYSKQRKEYLLNNPRCMVLGPTGRCPDKSTEVHHRKGRSGTNFLDVTTWLAVCETCHHQKIHGKYRAWAQRMNYMINRLSEHKPPVSNEFIPYE